MATFSKRATRHTTEASFLFDYFARAHEDPFDPVKNAKGIINLGTAENYLNQDLLADRFLQDDMHTWQDVFQFYNVHSGTLEFRSALADFLTDQLHTHQPLKPENIFTSSGAGAILEHLGFCLADVGEYLLLPTPAYSAFYSDLGCRAQVKIYEVPLKGRGLSEGEKPFHLTAEKVKFYYEKATSEGCTVRGLLIHNPSNPVGSVMNRKDIEDILQYCADIGIHVIVDEAYAMSVHDENSEFCSVLSLPNLPNPDGVHVVWTFSKDLGLSGMRCGLVHTMNKNLHFVLSMRYTYFTSVPIIVQEKLGRLIQDKEWMNNVYFPTNIARMRKSFKIVKEGLEEVGIKVYPSKGGFFIWADFSDVLHPLTFETEKSFFCRLIEEREGGVFVVPGSELHCLEPGWFRIVFTHEEFYMKTAIERIKNILKKMKEESPCSNKIELNGPELSNEITRELAGGTKGESSLEGMLSQVMTSIKSTNWLEENTAEKWEKENPDLAKAYKEAMEKQ